MDSVVVLNADLDPIDRVTAQHAVNMLVRNVAVIEQADPHRTYGPFPLPRVLRLARYVSLRWDESTPRWTKRRVLERDGFQCGYCASEASTIDHVVPRSAGGLSTWDNTVASCLGCNQVKADRTPAQAGMMLRTTPHVPSWWRLSA